MHSHRTRPVHTGPYLERVFFVRDHRTRATGCSPASDSISTSAVNHWTLNTGLAHVNVCGSGVYTLVGATHRTQSVSGAASNAASNVSEDSVPLP